MDPRSSLSRSCARPASTGPGRPFVPLVVAAMLVLLVAAPVTAQGGTAVLQIVVVDAETNLPIAGVELLVNGGIRGRTSGSDGMIEVRGVAGTGMALELRRAGYAPRALEVTPTAGVPMFVTVPLELSPTRLAPVEVEVERGHRSRALRDFYARARTGSGQYLTRAQIASRGVHHLGDLFRSLPGVDLVATPFGERPTLEAKGSFLPEPDGNDCAVQYFLDGTPVKPPAGAIGFDLDLNEVEGSRSTGGGPLLRRAFSVSMGAAGWC